MAWGIFMLIVLLGAGNGLINATMKMSGDFLTNSMEAYGGQTSKAYQGLSEGRYIQLNKRDIEASESEFKNNIDEVGACYYFNTTVTHGEQYMSMQIVGVYPVHTKIVKQKLICGRFVNDIDQREKRKVLVLNDKQAKELEPRDYKAMLGKNVKVGDFSFKVVGIYKNPGDGEGRLAISRSRWLVSIRILVMVKVMPTQPIQRSKVSLAPITPALETLSSPSTD